MNIIREILETHFDVGALGLDAKRKLVSDSIKYLLRTKTSSELSNDMKSITNKSIISYRQEITSNARILRDLKPFLWYCYRNNVTSIKDCSDIASTYNVPGPDIMLSRYLHERDRNELLVKIGDYSSPSHRKINVNLLRIYTSTLPYTRKFTVTKLRFIYGSGSSGLTFEDIVNELQYEGIKAVLSMYPRIECLKHAVNIAKKSIHNYGINFIYRHVTQKRKTIFESVDGYINILQPYVSNKHDLIECPNSLEGDISIKQLISTYKGKKGQVIKLLAGYESKEFSDWLAKKNITHDTDRYQTKLYNKGASKRYVNTVFKFLGVDNAKGIKFLSKVAKDLGY